MSEPYFADESIQLWHGDALEVLQGMPDGSVDCCVTSPPYFGLRDYGVEGQYGLEASPAEYVATMARLFSEVRRVLADDGTLWLNLGDSYSAATKGTGGTEKSGLLRDGRRETVRVAGAQRALAAQTTGVRSYEMDRAPKNLLGMPWRVAFALQDDGWTLRNAVVWHKSNAMPESVADRLSSRYEQVFLLSKSRRYWFDLGPIREPHTEVSIARAQPHRAAPGKSRREGLGIPPGSPAHTARLDQTLHDGGRNPGDVWTIPTSPFPGAHFACMPLTLAERCVQAGCKPNGTVLDPFSGSGTTGLAAARNGRRYVGIDLNAEYLDLSLRTRLAQSALIEGAS